MKTLDNEEMLTAREAVRILYRLGLLDIYAYEKLIARIERNTSE